jgi:hypothetical protein
MIELVMWKQEVCKKGKKVYNMRLKSMGNAKQCPRELVYDPKIIQGNSFQRLYYTLMSRDRIWDAHKT